MKHVVYKHPKRISCGQRLKDVSFHYVQAIVDRLPHLPFKRGFVLFSANPILDLILFLLFLNILPQSFLLDARGTYVVPYRPEMPVPKLLLQTWKIFFHRVAPICYSKEDGIWGNFNYEVQPQDGANPGIY